MLYGTPPVQTVAPTSQPITLAEVKAHLRIDHADEDAKLEAFILAAVSYLDGPFGYLGRCLMPQTWRHVFPGWGDTHLRLAMPSASQVVVTYIDPDGASQTLSTGLYEVVEDTLATVVIPTDGAVWPSVDYVANPVQVTAVHGYASAAAVPAAIKQAMLLMIGDWDVHRNPAVAGSAAQIPLSVPVEALLAPFRYRWLSA